MNLPEENLPKENIQVKKYIPQRGQLKYSINSSSKRIESGKEFSISISVTNPFDIPVIIKSVTTKLPIEFTDVMKEQFEEQKLLLEEKISKILKSNIPKLDSEKEKTKSLRKTIVEESLRLLPFGSVFIAGSAVAEYIRASNVSSAASINVIADMITEKDVERISNFIKLGENSNKEFEGELFKLLNEKMANLKNNLEQPIILQPGNTSIYVFTLRTKKTPLFTPSEYTLHLQLQYDVDETTNQDVIDYSFFIGSSLNSMIYGSVIGSFMGYVVKDIFQDNTMLSIISSFNFTSAISYLLILCANIILGIIAVILFSRKKDVQPILAIEDFWGGILLGFIVGYEGKSFVTQMFPKI
jgi:hypothetical protein